ncbi:MAG: Holliday junction branch migration DNA helicase RuvB [Halobacteriovoraceae bacterium]|nr:Holliday junction branch migration DNA helicase RuvB [Halobacteriovoraceae bacterium]
METDILRSSKTEGEKRSEEKLRPRNFTEFIGQKQIVDNIMVMAQSAQIRNQAMDHVLLSGPPGLGKTSLAMILAKFLDSELHLISGPAIDKKGDLAAMLSNLAPKDLLFIDEIHRMPVAVEEILYSAMEDFRMDIIMGQGPTARNMQLSLPPFTLIAATTRSGLLSAPLRDRFVAHLHFDLYDLESLAKIVNDNATKLSMRITQDACSHIARSARGTPRIANRILRRVRDYTLIEKKREITEKEVDYALNLMEIDKNGLDSMDRRIIHVIRTYYKGGPVGMEALCATLGEDKKTVEDVYEPWLLREGFIVRTSRGRMITKKNKFLSSEN